MKASATPADPLAASIAALGARVSKAARALGLDDIATRVDADLSRRMGDGCLRVAIIGEIKHGKSSLINALAGADVLPTGVTPTTGALVSVRAGDEDVRRVARRDGSSSALSLDRFASLARGVNDDEETKAGLLVAELHDPRLPAELELVDTPGLNDMHRLRALISEGEFPRADVLVLVLDATQALSRTELELMSDAIDALGGVRQAGSTLEVVVNRIDLISEQDVPKVMEHVISRLEGVLGHRPTPFTTDARSALKTPDAASRGVEGVRALRERLRFLAASRDTILPARMIGALRRDAASLAYHASIHARCVTLARDELQEEIDRINRAREDHKLDETRLCELIAARRETMAELHHARIDETFDGLLERARGWVANADLYELTESFPGAMRGRILELANETSARLRGELDDLCDELIATHGDLAARRVLESNLRLQFETPPLFIEPPSALVEAGSLALGLTGTVVMYFGGTVPGMLMTIASPMASMMLRERSVKEARDQSLAQLPEALADAASALKAAVTHVIERALDELERQIRRARAELGAQLSAVLDAAMTSLQETAPKDDGVEPGALRTALAHRSRRAQALQEQISRIERDLESMTVPAGGRPSAEGARALH